MIDKIKNNDGRFYIETPSGEAELLYVLDSKSHILSIYHTFVPDSERGKGIADKLAHAAFKFAIEKKVKVKPDCEYIKYFIEKHEEFKDFVF